MKYHNTIQNSSFKHWAQQTLVGLSSALLIACGGGGGGGASSNVGSDNDNSSGSHQDTISYEPNAEKLMQEAADSSELYVEQDFMFDHARLTQLDLSLADPDGNPSAYSRVKVYVVNLPSDEEVPEEWNDELSEYASLISGGLTNADGQLTRLIEFPGNGNVDQYLLLEVNVVGIQNKTLVPVQSTRTQVSL